MWREMFSDSQSSSREGRSCWASQVAQFQRNVGYQACQSGHDFIDEAEALKALRAIYDGVYTCGMTCVGCQGRLLIGQGWQHILHGIIQGNGRGARATCFLFLSNCHMYISALPARHP